MFTRYAVYFVPSGAWGDFGAAWLGWDSRSGQEVAGSDLDLVARPQKYGFHATIKAPFSLADGKEQAELEQALHELCGSLSRVELSSLQLSQLGRFFALTARKEQELLQGLAARVVQDLDAFRAAPTAQELARRRRASLSARQGALLEAWGYPDVMEEYQFHLTLTGQVGEGARASVEAALRPLCDEPMILDSLSLLGEGPAGRFHEITRAPLGAR